MSTSQPLAATPSQSAKPAAQRSTAHDPALHACAATLASAHPRPHAPQFDGSSVVDAQYAPPPSTQRVSDAPHVAVHAPAEHTCPAGHARPHAPHAALSVRVSVSQPSPGEPSQSAKPAAHAVIEHAPEAHADVAWASEHARPHAPQCAVVVRTSVSQPLAAVASQSP